VVVVAAGHNNNNNNLNNNNNGSAFRSFVGRLGVRPLMADSASRACVHPHRLRSPVIITRHPPLPEFPTGAMNIGFE
jgi:hypothetical protein